MPTSPTDTFLALDVGGTTITAALGTAAGEVLSREVMASHAEDGFRDMWDVLVDLAERELATGADAPRAIGVSIGGPVSSESGVVYSPPNLPGWDGIPMAEMLSERLGLPAFVEHDAKAGALAEWMFGAGRGLSNIVFLTLGTGLGAGLIIDGRLCHGRLNNIGEVGHWRMAPTGPMIYGKPGSWEGFSSGAGLAALARMTNPERWDEATTAAGIFKAARTGDVAASALVERFACELGKGTALLVDLLAPEIVVLGSLAFRAGDLFLARVREIVHTECTERNLPCPVVPAELGEDLGIVAALAVAASRFTEPEGR